MMRDLAILFSVLLLLSYPVPAAASDGSEAMILLVKTIAESQDPAVRVALMQGMLDGLSGRRNVVAPPEWAALRARMANSDHPRERELATKLSQIFGEEAALKQALATVGDEHAPLGARRTALRTLLGQRNPSVVELLPGLLKDPELRRDAVRGYSAVEVSEAPNILLEQFREFADEDRRAVIETLATRKTYAKALLAALKSGQLSRDQIPAHVARSLKLILGDSFVSVFGDVRSLTEDREQLMEKYRRLATDEALAKADASRGRVVFKKTCAACHVLYGSGGKIGPDLTGSNRANLDYVLLNSVDPSYDVPEGYKMVIVQTVDGRVLNGVIAEEDATRLVLKTVEQPRVVIDKEDIESRRVSPKSMMPDGQLDQMKPQQVLDLIRYLRTTEQVELPN